MDASLNVTASVGNTAMLNHALGHDGEGLATAAGKAGLRNHTMFATSGVSGGTKFVCLSHAAQEASARAVNAFYGVSSTDCWLCALPPFHVGGNSIVLRALLAEARFSRMEWREWSVARFLEACRENAVTLAPLVPTQLYDLVEAKAHPSESLRAAIIGGGALDPALRASAEALGWPIRETYGMTEAASHLAAEPDGGGALEVLPHWEAKADEESRLWLRGPALFSGYLVPKGDGHWEFERPFDTGGWFRTDDRVELTGRTLRVLGRASALVKILGELVDVASVERRFVAMSGCGEHAALVAKDDARRGKSLVLAIEPPLEVSAVERAVADFNASVPGFERIGEVRAVAAIPRVALGKVAREEVRALISRPSEGHR